MNNIIDYVKIGNRIKKLRNKKGITQQKICSDLNISIYHFSRIENGKTGISLEVLAEISKYLDVDITTLLTGTSTIDKKYLNDELSNLYNSCSAKEKRIILETVKTLVKNLKL